MPDIDERIVSMKFDNAQFEKGVSTSLSSLDKLKNSLSFKGVEKGFDNISNAAKNLNLNGAQNAVNSFFDNLSLKSIAQISLINNLITDVYIKGKRLINDIFVAPKTDGFREYELKMGSVQTIIASTGKELSVVNKYLEDLNVYADKTIYSFKDMTSSIGKFTNAGVELEDAVMAIKGISNEAAVSGANTQEASRAMYNFAQALSAGYVKLIDWKSIENANMATKEFKQELIDSALALGTVVKEGDKYRSVTTDLNNKTSELFTATSMFNDSLSAQWMTTDVLVKTLSRYADETTDIGKKAYAAAQDVKTFSQLMDTFKEALGSGWSRSFEIVIGDFNEAKELFTTISGLLDHIVGIAFDVQNGLLQMWKDNGGREKLIKDIKTITENLSTLSDKVVKTVLGPKYAKFIDDQADSTEKLSKSVESYSQAEMEAARAIWYGENKYGNGEDRVKNLEAAGLNAQKVQEYVEKLSSSGWSFDEAVEHAKETLKEVKKDAEKLEETTKWTKWSKAFDNIIRTVRMLGASLKNISGIFTNIGRTITEAFLENIDIEMITTDIRHFTRGFMQLTGRLKEGTEEMSTLKSIVTILTEGINFLWKKMSNLIKSLSLLEKSSKAFKTINDAINNLYKSAKTYLLERGGVKGIIDSFISRFDFLRTKIEAFVNYYKKIRFEGFINYGKRILKSIKDIGVNISVFFDNLKKGKSVVNPIMNFFKDLWTVIANIAKFISPIFAALWDSIKSTAAELNTIDLSNILAVIREGGIIYLIKKIVDFFNSISSGPRNIGEFFGSIRDNINDFIDKIKPDKLENTAKSLAVLTGSLLVLSLIPADRITKGLIAITVMSGVFLGFIYKLQGILTSAPLKNMALATTGIVKLSAALLILSFAVNNLGKTGLFDIIKGMAAIVSLIYTLSVFLNKTDLDNVGFRSGFGLISLSVAIGILSLAIKALSKLNPWELLQGILAIGITLGTIAKATDMISPSKIISFGASLIPVGIGITIISAALKLLSKIPMAKLLKAGFVLGGVLTLITVLTDVMPVNMLSVSTGFTILSIGIIILTKALEKLSSFTAKKIISSLVTLAGAMTIMAIASNFMAGSIPGAVAMVVMAMGVKILSKALKLLADIPLKNILESLIGLTVAVVAFAAISAAITPILPAMLALGGTLIVLGAGIAVIGGGLLAISAAITGLSLSLAIMGENIGVFVVELAKQAPMLALIAEKFLIAFAVGLIEGIPQIIKALSKLVNSALDWFANDMPILVGKAYRAFYNFLDSFANEIVANSEKIARVTKKISAAISVGILEGMQEYLGDIPVIGEAIDSALSLATFNFTKANMQLNSYGHDGGTAYTDGVEDAVEGADTSFLSKMFDPKNIMSKVDVKKMMTVDPEGFRQLSNGLSNNISDAIDVGFDEASIEEALNEVGQIPTDEYMKPEEYEYIADVNWSAYSEEVRDRYPQTKEEGAEMSKEGAEGAETTLPLYKDAAHNLVAGFANEIRAGRMRAYAVGKVLAAAVKNAIDDQLDIHSPSRETAKSGMYAVLGFVKGIEDYTSEAGTAATALGDQTVEIMKSPIERIMELLDGTLEYDPTIRPLLDTTQLETDINRANGLFGSTSYGLAGVNARINRASFDSDIKTGSPDVVQAINELRGDFNEMSTKLDNMQVVMDTGALVGSMAGPMDGALGRRQIYKGRGN